jgi:hypothetical protein
MPASSSSSSRESSSSTSSRDQDRRPRSSGSNSSITSSSSTRGHDSYRDSRSRGSNGNGGEWRTTFVDYCDDDEYDPYISDDDDHVHRGRDHDQSKRPRYTTARDE